MSTPDGPLRVYVLRGGQPHHVASCDGDALAFTLLTLTDEGQIDADDRIGIMERLDPDEPGRWIVKPWAAGRQG